MISPWITKIKDEGQADAFLLEAALLH